MPVEALCRNDVIHLGKLGRHHVDRLNLTMTISAHQACNLKASTRSRSTRYATCTFTLKAGRSYTVEHRHALCIFSSQFVTLA